MRSLLYFCGTDCGFLGIRMLPETSTIHWSTKSGEKLHRGRRLKTQTIKFSLPVGHTRDIDCVRGGNKHGCSIFQASFSTQFLFWFRWSVNSRSLKSQASFWYQESHNLFKRNRANFSSANSRNTAVLWENYPRLSSRLIWWKKSKTFDVKRRKDLCDIERRTRNHTHDAQETAELFLHT